MLHITTLFNLADSLMALNIIHGVITFIMFHWIKGCPDETSQVYILIFHTIPLLISQMEYSGLTLYEQIDAGVPWTWNKKFLIMIPTVM